MDKDYMLAICNYLTQGVYPQNLSKTERRTMRKSAESFVCTDGILYHIGRNGRNQLVVYDPQEKRRIISTMHLNTSNRVHNGINATVHKIFEYYWWRGVSEEVRSFCKSCTDCAGFFESANWAPTSAPHDAQETLTSLTVTGESVTEMDDREEACSSATSLQHLDNGVSDNVNYTTWDTSSQIFPDSTSCPGSPLPTPAEYREMSCQTYGTDLLKSLYDLYINKVHCDVFLSAGGCSVKAHKVVLVASSEYFKVALSEQYLATTNVLHLTDVSGVYLECIVSFMYCGKLNMCHENAPILLATATKLGVQSAVDLCAQYLSNPKGEEETVKDDCNDDNDDANQTAQAIADTSKIGEIVGRLGLTIKTEESSPLAAETSRVYPIRSRRRTEVSCTEIVKTCTAAPSSERPALPPARKRGRPRKISAEVKMAPIEIKQEVCDDIPLRMIDDSDDDTRDNDWDPEEELSAKRRKTRSTSLGSGRGSSGPVSKSVFVRKKKVVKSTRDDIAKKSLRRIGSNKLRQSNASNKSLLRKKENLRVDRTSYAANSDHISRTRRRRSSAVLHGDARRRRLLVNRLIKSEGDAYPCSVCDVSFMFSAGLTLHKRKSHSVLSSDLTMYRLSRRSVMAAARYSNKLSCQLCGKSFGNHSQLYNHRRTHNKTNKGRRALRSQGRDNNSILVGQRLFSTLVRILRQERIRSTMNSTPAALHHSASAQSVSASVFRNRCGWCGTSYGSRAELLEHRRAVHAPKVKQPTVVVAQRTYPRMKRTHLDWSCKERGCTAPFRSKEALKSHMAVAHSQVVISCPGCKFKTQLEYFLKRHMVKRHRERHRCAECGRGFHKRFILKVHMYNQHKISDPTLKLYHCLHEGCGYACPSKNALRLHTQKHNISKPYTCHICGKNFKRPDSLEKHIGKIHLGIRPYICDKCGVSYSAETELKRHVARHDKNKPFSCELCTFSTYDKSNLQSHLFCRHKILLNTKTPVLVCTQCSFTTDKKCRFTDHMRMHENMRDIPCPECGKLFCTKKTMRQHIGKVHKHSTQRCKYCAFTTILPARLAEHMRMMHMAQNETISVEAAAAAIAQQQLDMKLSTAAADMTAEVMCDSPRQLTLQQLTTEHKQQMASQAQRQQQQDQLLQAVTDCQLSTNPVAAIFSTRQMLIGSLQQIGSTNPVVPFSAPPMSLNPVFQSLITSSSVSTGVVVSSVSGSTAAAAGTSDGSSADYHYAPFDRRLHVL